MGFFLETLIGGLMTGMLYSLIALGFVLIFKASGVFNFAQGAMVLFAALAMARFSEWFQQWLHFDSKVLANVLAFAGAVVVMIVVAWLIERLALSKLVNQEGITLLMATLGIAYFLDGFGQTVFGNDIYKIDVGLPKDPIFLLDNVFQGGVLVNKEDLYAATIEYWPVALCLESKSLKLYLSGYRNEGHFCEALAVKIRDDVAEALELPPDKVRVTLKQKARGGITITATS